MPMRKKDTNNVTGVVPMGPKRGYIAKGNAEHQKYKNLVVQSNGAAPPSMSLPPALRYSIAGVEAQGLKLGGGEVPTPSSAASCGDHNAASMSDRMSPDA